MSSKFVSASPSFMQHIIVFLSLWGRKDEHQGKKTKGQDCLTQKSKKHPNCALRNCLLSSSDCLSLRGHPVAACSQNIFQTLCQGLSFLNQRECTSKRGEHIVNWGGVVESGGVHEKGGASGNELLSGMFGRLDGSVRLDGR